MVHKAIHHFSRAAIIGFEVAGVLAILVMLAWGGLLWRLSQGPLNADYLTGYLAKALNEEQDDFVFDIGTTELTWSGRFHPVEVQMDRVSINRPDKTPVLLVDRINIELSKRHMLFGRIVPRTIEIHGPTLRVIRWEDGHFTLNLGAAPAAQADAPLPPPAEGGTDLIGDLLKKLQEKRIPLLGGLREVRITGASGLYDDHILHVAWKSRSTDVSFTRGAQGITSAAAVTLELDAAHTASIDARASYSWKTRETLVVAGFIGFNPALAAQTSEALKDFAGVNLQLKGGLAVTLDPAFVPKLTRFEVGADDGAFSGFGLYDAPVPVKKLYVRGHLDLKTLEGAIEKCTIDLGGPKVEATLVSAPQEGKTRVTAQAALVNTPISDLKTWWPESLAASARGWVTGHLSKGTAQKATLDLALRVGPGPERKVELDKVGGRIDFTGIKVDYFPPLMPVTGVDGFATYDEKSFSLDLKSGQLGDMNVKKSTIRITDLDIANDTVHSKIDAAVTLHGPLKTALKVLDSKPLEYPRELGIQTAEVGGTADIDVDFRFPLFEALSVRDVQVKAGAALDDVSLKNMVSDLDLTGGPMNLTLDGDALAVAGKGKIGGMPVSFKWLRHLAADAKIRQKIEAKLPLSAETLVKFGVPADFSLAGQMPADVSYILSGDKTGALALTGDLRGLAFAVPQAGFKKDADTPGSLSLTLRTVNDKPREIRGLDLQAGGSVLKGGMDFDDAGVSKVSFTNLILGDTDVAVAADKDKAGQYSVRVTGRQADLSQLLQTDEKPGSDEEAAIKTAPVALSLNVGRILTGKDKYIDKAKILLQRTAWRRIERLEMDGVAGGGAITVRYVPVPNGHSLRLQAANAGAALSALGFTNGIKKGRLLINGNPVPNGGPRDLAGQAVLSDFTLVGVPVLARLLNALSLPGLFNLMNGQGIDFHKAKTEFFWTDRGQPLQQKNARVLRLKDGETSGSSLGLTFEGYIDEWTKTYDLSGTIIPVSDVNKLVASIPLVGTILTGGGDSVFAATYVIKGPKSDPSVIVNPISVLAPGILRKLFFEK